jgi:FMN phosphatase YigB (HAD superfamily)
MIKAVLLDLDDTLLRTHSQQFVERYLAALVDTILAAFPSLTRETVDHAIHRSARTTVTSLDPTRTNAQVFSETLSAILDLPVEVLTGPFDAFHKDAYLRLGHDPTVDPAAKVLVDRLCEMGAAVVIATNPLFPLGPIMQRLAWAGLDSPPVPYALITHISNMHFTKPNPQYYEEILARVGVEADEAIMVGDNLINDITAAAQAGLNTFWIDQGTSTADDQAMPDGSGTLADFDQLVASGGLATLKPRTRTADQVVPRMLGDVGALYGLVSEINPAYWNMRPDPNEWSPLETLCHLRDSERNVQRPRLKRIAAEDNPFISQPKTPPGPGERDLSAEDGYAALRDFWDERCQTITFLQTLHTEDWERPARHSIFGPTTLLEMAHFTTRHDHLHTNQLCETIGKCKSAR